MCISLQILIPIIFIIIIVIVLITLNNKRGVQNSLTARNIWADALQSLTSVRKESYGPEGNVLRTAGATPEACTPIPIGALIQNQMKDILPLAINKELQSLGPLKYTANVESVGTMCIASSSPLKMTSLIFDPAESTICGDLLTISALAVFNLEGVQIKLFASENIGQASLSARLVIKATLKDLNLKIQSITLSQMSFNAPDRPDITLIVGLVVPSLQTFLNSEFSKLFPPSASVTLSPLPPQLLTETPDIKRTIADFITKQVNAMLQTPLIKTAQFKVCNTCPASTIGNIQLAKTAWAENSGCAGLDSPIVGCIGCSWAYQIGVNSIQGLDNMSILRLELGNLEFTGNLARYYFNLALKCSGVSMRVTAQAQPCTGGYVGIDNTSIPIPGDVIVTLPGAFIEGKYNSATNSTIFYSNLMEIPNVDLRLSIPTSWAKISTGNAIVDAILSPIFALIDVGGSAGTGLFQTAINAIIRSTLNDTIKDVLNNVVDKIPQVQVSIPTPAPVPPQKRTNVQDCGWNDKSRGYYDVTGNSKKLDYCRYVGDGPNIWFSCALAGSTQEYTAKNDRLIKSIDPNSPHDSAAPGDSCYGK